MRYWTIHHAWKVLASLLILFVFVGCTNATHKTDGTPNTKTYFGYAIEATERGNWGAAYRLMEDALVDEDPALRIEAKNLIDKFPQIRKAAFESFSKLSLEKSYQTYGEQAWLIEEERLSIYEVTLATPEQAAQARHNFQDVYGDRIIRSQAAKKISFEAMAEKWRLDNEFEKEIQVAILSSTLIRTGDMLDLFKGMDVGTTLRKQAIERFGRPSRTFELNTILTWAVRVEDGSYSILADFIRNQGGVTHSLVMTFDESLVLNDMAMVRVVK